MRTVRKTITVTQSQNEWIKSQVACGKFTNDSEYVRDLIRRDQTQLMEIELIRHELIKGEKSGEPRLFDIERFKTVMASKNAEKTP